MALRGDPARTPLIWATMYVDASFREDHGGGWGIWAKSGRGRIIRRGSCPDYVRTSQHAELAAVFAGLGLVQREWPGVKGVLIKSDCQGAIDALDFRLRYRDATMNKLQSKIKQLLRENDMALRAAWVQGHSREITTPAYLNRECDLMARAARLDQLR
jgi:ribonuclease HI